jgi:5-(carboxyamino)imidazole ribonucleotide synthase
VKVGVLGAGQLGRMLALGGYPLGMSFVFVDPAADAPAGQLAELVVADYEDDAALRRLAECDVVTYEFESVPVAAAEHLAQRVAVRPPPEALRVAQDRLNEKRFLNELGIPTPRFAAVGSETELAAALAEIGTPAVLKTRREGYDGKGQRVIRSESDAGAAWRELGGVPLILEAFVPFDREVSLIAVRGRDGRVAFYPLVENHHVDGMLRTSFAPAPDLQPALQTRAEEYGRALVERLDYVGVVALELFEARGELLANEIAPRVHNSGHWTIEGAKTSQFENHLRAIAGWPLGDTAACGLSAMVNLVGSVPDRAHILAIPGAHLHVYAKEPRPGRKVGHVTLRADDLGALKERVRALQALTG